MPRIAPSTACFSRNEWTVPTASTVPPLPIVRSIRDASRAACRSSAFSTAARTSEMVARTSGSILMTFATRLTPVRRSTARSASARWLQLATVPSSVTIPPDTVERIWRSGTVTSHSSAWRTAWAMSASERCAPPAGLTTRSFATSRTPDTRWAASAAARTFAQLSTVPASVTIPFLTCTPISVGATRVSQANSRAMSALMSWSFFLIVGIVSSVSWRYRARAGARPGRACRLPRSGSSRRAR